MSRPYSSTGRPSTGSPPYLDPRYQYPETPTTASTSASDVQWAYGSNSRPYTGAGEDLYEEDESEDEDVFAYLPPTTAEQQAAEEHHQQSHIQPASAPLASVQPVTYLNDRPALSSPTPVLEPSTPVHPSANRRPATASDSSVERSAPPESFRMRSLKERIPRQNKTPEVHVSLEDPEMGQLRPKRSISTDNVMEQLPGPSALDDHKFAKHGDGATLSSLHFTASRRSDFSGEYEAQYEEEEDSPYPEVRASVSNIDDPEMPALTFRVWFIGMFLSMIAAGANTFFNFRYPAPTLVPLIMLLVSYPTGKFFAFILPIYDYQLPRWLGGGTFSFNPGPFNIKEHVLLYIMSNVATAPGYAMNVIVVTEHFYKIRLGIAWNLLLMFATQLTGFGIAGICRRYLVWPASMIWPQNLVVCTLLNTLHAEDDEPGRSGITRFKFYLYVTIGTFVWQFLPGFLFTALSAFSWICWFRPRDVKINQLFGVYSGLGMGVLTFDWAQISYVGSPMMVPWWAEVHVMLGFLIFYWILTPILYYKNVWNFAYLPMSTSGPFDRFGQAYNVSRVIDMQTYTLNVTAYEEYSELYLPATYAITYLLAFSVSTAVLVHTILYHGPTLLAGLKNLRVEDDDVHARLMRLYPEVPDWWYLVVLVTFFAVGMVAVLVYPTGMPWWGMPFSLLLPVVYVVPIAYVYAMTGQPVNINLLSEIIPGSLIHGKPLPNMIFKSYAVQSLAEALTFVQDLKLGHYIKVAPRSTFIVQMVATFSSAVVQVGVKEWMFHNIKDMCTENQPQKISCPHYRVYFTASAVWGLIGPTRMFGKGATYNPQLYALLFGALIPIPFWFWQRKFPQSRFRYINIPVLLNGPMWIPPATGINYSSWFVVGFFFQYILRRRNFRWWSKFNYALSAALDSGTFLSLIILFFCVQFPLGDKGDIQWWGNTVHMNTADYLRQPLLTAPPEGFS